MVNTEIESSSLRRVLLILALAAVMPLALLRSEPAAAQVPAVNGPIAATALQYLNTHGGQCWTFMKDVVYEATGRTMGYGYRDGYFAAGAVEVSAAEAQNGDVIQIASDSASGPWGSYPGLHTAIILENLGGGRFNAIDSNQNWDEWVRLRPSYDPYAAAARYGLQVHIYRFPGGGPGGEGVTTVSGPVTWGAGARAIVSTSGCLNLRSEPGIASSRVGCLPAGASISVTGEPVIADGYTWVPVETTAGPGWLAAEYLSQVSAPVEAAAPPEPEVAAPPAEVAVEAPAAAPAAGIAESAAYTDGSPGCLRVRTTSGLGGTIIDCLPAFTRVIVLPDTPVESDGYTWMKVRVNGRTGWLAGEYLVR